MSKAPAAGLWHAGFTVSDAERTAEYFRDVLALEISEPVRLTDEAAAAINGVKQAGLIAIFVTGESFTIELLQYATSRLEGEVPAEPDRIGGGHLAFYVDDLDRVLEEGAKWGRRRLAGIYVPQAGPRKGWRVCYTTDDDGFLIEFVERTAGV